MLEVYVVWHPEDVEGRQVSKELIDHFHGTAFSGLVGGAVEVYNRSAEWTPGGVAPLPLPFVEDLPNGTDQAEVTVVVPVLGLNLAQALQSGGPWETYISEMTVRAEASCDKVLVIPVRVANTPDANGRMYELLGGLQSVCHDDGLCRDIAQATTQFFRESDETLTVFLSHTKRRSGDENPAKLVQRVRRLIAGTRLRDFFDAHDLKPGFDWADDLETNAANGCLLAIRTDLYATREWCQKEVLIAKRAGIPVVILDALTKSEERGSFLMDHAPRISLRKKRNRDRTILLALELLVDECLKRALWKRQQELAAREGIFPASWWAPHAPEPITFTDWINKEGSAHSADDPLVVLHPDPPLGPDELLALREIAAISDLDGSLEVMTPRGLAVRGG